MNEKQQQLQQQNDEQEEEKKTRGNRLHYGNDECLIFIAFQVHSTSINDRIASARARD